ncbi:efflux transporter outer membrane subunit [Ottowia sp.]|uniref:efflux transporter outer membrane subunit n=1 Tax=Ottowia sp. TaxID=1898956 RepID=UPI002C1A0F4A|nr:efflux transporter outer membrane subunit [Ottowia sp.]HRN76435.1 efflux transporter outer membrane subunit [Ottowia sp.]HRQ03496.1 efflux transporter outer membrane subunit [Ottowia sp.]
MRSITSPTLLRPVGRLLGAGVLLATLAACSFVPVYERPAAPVASSWPDSAGAQLEGAVAAADLPWQQFVQDAQLRELIQLALDSNRDLRVAVQAIEQARAQYQIRRSDQFPTIGVSAAASRSAPNPAGPDAPSVASNYSVMVGGASWELDFFGRVAALKDVALTNYLATEEARKSAQISLIAAVSSSWLQLKTDTELLALAERTLGTREQSLKLTRLRFDHGASSALDMRLAESLTANAQATRAQQARLRAQDINLLTLLVGQPIPAHLLPSVPAVLTPEPPRDLSQPTPVVAPVAELPAFAEVPAGLPSELLLRRPDIRAAEQQLIGANANIGAARANFFPRISLTGSLGRVSSDLDGLLGSGGSRAWSFGPSLLLPIFDMGRNQATLEAAQAAREIAVAQYEKAIQTAFREVADALAGRATWTDQLAALQAQAEAERERFRLVDLRYRNGIANYLDLLDAQRSLFAIEQALAQVRLAQRANEVQLYKALGGGWTEPVAELPGTRTAN